jgi:hypothetical protein
MQKIIQNVFVGLIISGLISCNSNNKNDTNYRFYTHVSFACDFTAKSVEDYVRIIESLIARNGNRDCQVHILKYVQKVMNENEQIVKQLQENLPSLDYPNHDPIATPLDWDEIENLSDTKKEKLRQLFFKITMMEKKFGGKILNSNYQQSVLNENIEKGSFLLYLATIEYDVQNYTQSILKKICIEVENSQDLIRADTNNTYAIVPHQEEIYAGETFKASVFAYRKLCRLPILRMEVNNVPIPIDSTYTGHYRVKAHATQFDNNGLARKTIKAKLTFVYNGKDTSFYNESHYWVKKRCD